LLESGDAGFRDAFISFPSISLWHYYAFSDMQLNFRVADHIELCNFNQSPVVPLDRSRRINVSPDM
jgi:hypothetical protein